MKAFTLSANRDWKFFRGTPPKGRIVSSGNPHDSGLQPYERLYDDSGWEVVHLPHTVRVENLLCSGGKNYQGEYWYRKKFIVETDWQDKELFFVFDGIMQRADVWVDGNPAGYALGGFLPVRIPVTGLSAGEHVLAVKANNADLQDVPPGKKQGALDFCYFGGLYRNARFVVANKVRFSDAVHEGRPAAGGLYIRTFPDGKKAEVRVRASVLNHTAVDVAAQLRLFLDGEPVRESRAVIASGGETDFTFSLTIDSPRLWSPAHPALYALTAQLLSANEILEERTERFGIRKAEFKEDGFYLNGEKLYLNGVNRHQEYPYVGFALPDSLQRRDLTILREAGINCIRTAHYPPDEAFMNVCDELGILCVIPTPGWQLYPASQLFDERSYENTRRILRWHRNHPAALLWEPILNETDYPEYFAEKQLQIVREECGDAPAFAACDSCSRGAEHFPVNYRCGETAADKPLFVREYGDAYMEQYGPMGTMRRVRRGRNTGFYPGGERAMLRNAAERLDVYTAQYRNPRIGGGALWCAFDNNRGYELTEGAWGMCDFLRVPKFFYHLLAAQQPIEQAGARCFIANFWTEDSPSDVSVYTNAPSVRLLLHGKTIAEKRADCSDGIRHPVVFEHVAFEKGVLRAEAIAGGRVVKSHEVRTPLAPVAVRLTPQYAGVNVWKADGADLLMVHAAIVDENGTVVPDAEHAVRFFVRGDAAIVGQDEPWVGADCLRAEAGVTGVLLRAGRHSGNVTLCASADGLADAVLTLQTKEDDRTYLPGETYGAPKEQPRYACDANEFFSVRESIRDTQSHNWDAGVLKPAWASSAASGFGAENANQKTFGQPWRAADTSLPQWWCCDLSDVYNVNGVAVSWEKDWLWYDYAVETSADGVKWQVCYRGSASGQTRLPSRFPSSQAARFVRIVIQGLSGKECAGIYHVEIFGKKPQVNG